MPKTKPGNGASITAASDADGVSASELLHLLVATVVDYAIFALDATGHIRTWNPGAQRLKGYTADEIIGKHFSIFYPEADVRAGKPARELEIAKRDGRVEDEGWRVRKDGSMFWANVVITALHDKSGKLVGFAKVTRDLTARRNTEEQARRLAAEEAARQATTTANEDLRRLNDQLQNQAVELEAQQEESQSLAEELETANTELEERVTESEIARDTAEQAERRTSFLVRAGDVLSTTLGFDERLQELAQLVVPHLADWCAVEIGDESGQSRQVAVAHKDPEKVQFAREVGERYPTDPHAPSGVPAVLRSGKPELYPEISDEMLATTAQDPEHLRLIKELHLRSAIIAPLIARGRTLGAITLVRSESTRPFTESDLDFTMELARRAAISVDNGRLHQEVTKALEEAREANKAKAQFLAVMSHELRTPLNAIAGYADLLRLGVQGPVNEEQQHALDRILESERGLLSLINNILNFARVEAGRVEVKAQTIPLRALMDGADGLVLPQLQEKSLRFVYEQPPASLAVCVDPDKFRQILLNLLSNAIKFTPEGGQITLSARADAHRGYIAVTDTGHGIPEDKLSNIFEPFVQLERTLTSEQRGSGLGLSISRELARAMKGDLVVESEEGKGSRFTIVLPLK